MPFRTKEKSESLVFPGPHSLLSFGFRGRLELVSIYFCFQLLRHTNRILRWLKLPSELIGANLLLVLIYVYVMAVFTPPTRWRGERNEHTPDSHQLLSIL